MSELTEMKKTQQRKVNDFLWCCKNEILVHMLKKIKKGKIIKKFEIIDVKVGKIGRFGKV